MRPLDHSVPSSVGHYQIVGEVARGGHGIVCEGIDVRTSAKVAIKFIPQEKVSERVLEGNLERISTEASVLQDLKHPGLVNFLNCGYSGHFIYFVFEFIEGVSLKKFILKNGSVNEGTFLKMALQLAEALRYTHLQGVLHNDLSSNNVMVMEKTEGPLLKILDFGLATLFDVIGQPHESQMGAATLFYAAPERIGLIDSPVDVRSDLFSLGCILYEMLKGKPPYDSPHSQELMVSLTTQPLTSLWADADTIPLHLREIVNSLIKLDPNDRYQSPAGLVKDLTYVHQCFEKGQLVENLSLHLDQRLDIVSSKTKMFGRKKELDTLLKAFSLAETGVPNLSIVSGPVGIGKSRLISEFRAATVPKLSTFISIRHDTTFNNKEFGFVAEILISYIRKIQKLTGLNAKDKVIKLKSLIQKNISLIANYFPFLIENEIFKNFSPIALNSNDDGSEKDTKKLIQFLCDLSYLEKSYIFHIDEFQLMDQNSKSLLCEFLSAAKKRSLKIYFVLTVTLTETEQRRSARELMESLKGGDILTQHIALKQLTPSSVQSIIIDALKSSVQNLEELSHYVLNTSAGNPLMVQEIIKNLVSLEALSFSSQSKSWVFEPSKIESSESNHVTLDLMLARLNSIDADIRLILSTAASYGPKFTSQILYKIYPEFNYIIPEVLRKAVSEQLITESDNVFSFTHQRIYQVFLEDHTYAPIREIHERLLRYAEKNPEDDIGYEIRLATHAYFTKSKADIEKTFIYCLRAQWSLMKIHHLHQAFVHAERCYEILNSSQFKLELAPDIRLLFFGLTGLLVNWMGIRDQWKERLEGGLSLVPEDPTPDVGILQALVKCLCGQGGEQTQKLGLLSQQDGVCNSHWLKVFPRDEIHKLVERMARGLHFQVWFESYWREGDSGCGSSPKETLLTDLALDPHDAWELFFENFTSERSMPEASTYLKRELESAAQGDSPRQRASKIYLSLIEALEEGLSWSGEEIARRLQAIRILESSCRIQGQMKPVVFSNLIFGSIFLARGDTLNARQLLSEAVLLGKEEQLDMVPELEANLGLFCSLYDAKNFNDIYFKYMQHKNISKRAKYLLNSGHFLVVFCKDPFLEHDISVLDSVGGSPWVNRWPGNVFVRHFLIARAILDRIQKCQGNLSSSWLSPHEGLSKRLKTEASLLISDYIEHLIHAFVFKGDALCFHESSLIELEQLAKEQGFLNIQLIIRLVIFKLKFEWSKQLSSDLVLDEAFTHLEASTGVAKILGFTTLEKSLLKEYESNGFSLKNSRNSDNHKTNSSHLTTFFRRARIEKVLEYSNKLALCSGTEVFLSTILTGFMEISGSQRGLIINVADANPHHEIRVSQNLPEISGSFFLNEDNSLKAGLSWKAINLAIDTMEPVYGFPHEIDESFLSDFSSEHSSVKSLAAIPIIHDSRIFAVVYLDNLLISRLYTPDVLWSLEPLKVQLAIHTANRWLMTSSIQQYEDLKQLSQIANQLHNQGVDTLIKKINTLLNSTCEKIKDQVLQINKLNSLHESNALKYSSQLLETVRKEIVIYGSFFNEIEKNLETNTKPEKDSA